MATSNPSGTFHEPLPLVQKAGTWFIMTAVAFIALGTIAIIAPFFAGLAVTAFVGWLLIAGGFMHAVNAFRTEGIWRSIWQVVVAVFYVIAGFYFLTHPLIALGTLTLFLAGVLFVESAMDAAAWFATRKEAGAGWLLVNAAVTLLLSVLIWRQWPAISVWAIGTLVGVNLLVNGFSRLMLGTAVRSVFRERHA